MRCHSPAECQGLGSSSSSWPENKPSVNKHGRSLSLTSVAGSKRFTHDVEMDIHEHTSSYIQVVISGGAFDRFPQRLQCCIYILDLIGTERLEAFALFMSDDFSPLEPRNGTFLGPAHPVGEDKCKAFFKKQKLDGVRKCRAPQSGSCFEADLATTVRTDLMDQRPSLPTSGVPRFHPKQNAPKLMPQTASSRMSTFSLIGICCMNSEGEELLHASVESSSSSPVDRIMTSETHWKLVMSPRWLYIGASLAKPGRSC